MSLNDRSLSILDGLRLGESPYLHPFFLHLASGMERNHPSWNLPPMESTAVRDTETKTKIEDDAKTPPENSQPLVHDFQKVL
ncbi:uncharacterized protein CEXT_744121 [Caerostris extrusa]|uniref:Uncharacterized protein n=1 Tax=Caerostris extrusa TaxID=172846 RepID=A0AAV4Q944_CAEEX|nr:uncharacterized protein CEXT_744121 [Caerostris extrusa]